MLITTKKNQNKLDLIFDNQEAEQVQNFKYLGVILDDEIKFVAHFKILMGKLIRALGIFSRAATFLLASARITLYHTLILPHIDYCSTVWSNSLRKQDLSKLQRIQNRGMRIVLGCHPRTHIVDMLDSLKWVSIKQRFHYNLSIPSLSTYSSCFVEIPST